MITTEDDRIAGAMHHFVASLHGCKLESSPFAVVETLELWHCGAASGVQGSCWTYLLEEIVLSYMMTEIVWHTHTLCDRNITSWDSTCLIRSDAIVSSMSLAFLLDLDVEVHAGARCTARGRGTHGCSHLPLSLQEQRPPIV